MHTVSQVPPSIPGHGIDTAGARGEGEITASSASTPRTANRPHVLRALSSQITFWLVAGICALLLLDELVRGDVLSGLRSMVLCGFGVWCAWAFLYRMSIRLGYSEVTVVNLLRRTTVPWHRVDDVTRRMQIMITLDNGTRIQCWGSPFAPRPGAVSASSKAGIRGGSADPALADVIASWRQAPVVHDQRPVRSEWDIPAISVGFGLLVCSIIVWVT